MILFGASGHCKSIIDISDSLEGSISFIFDDNPKNEEIFGIPVGVLDDGKRIEGKWIISIGNNISRKSVSKKLDVSYGNLFHKSCSISSYTSIGVGTVVMAHAVINAGVVIGSHCIINTASVVEHDCSLEDFVHISPNASLAGEVSVGEGAQVGIGACVLQGIKIGKWAVIGAGAVIINNVPDYAVVVGNPGRVIKYITKI